MKCILEWHPAVGVVCIVVALLWIEYRNLSREPVPFASISTVMQEPFRSLAKNEGDHLLVEAEEEREASRRNPPAGTAWSASLRDQFKKYQETMYKNAYQYNLKVLQENAKAWEVEEMMRTGKWPWAKEVEMRYRDAMEQHPILNYEPTKATLRAREIYPQKVALMLLAHNNAKKGKEHAIHRVHNLLPLSEANVGEC